MVGSRVISELVRAHLVELGWPGVRESSSWNGRSVSIGQCLIDGIPSGHGWEETLENGRDAWTEFGPSDVQRSSVEQQEHHRSSMA